MPARSRRSRRCRNGYAAACTLKRKDNIFMCVYQIANLYCYHTGKCMSRLNVSAMDTRDAQGRGRFFPFFPEQHIFPGKVTKDYWYCQAIYYPAKEVKYKTSKLLLGSLRLYPFRDWNAVQTVQSLSTTSNLNKCSSWNI